ncbi:hypothetical protein DFH09DRAFT_1076617 [Mycena vulgaris]|nr:hypothetical protein DFH09DRAFT_1076617 [Mycena vulgaris]
MRPTTWDSIAPHNTGKGTRHIIVLLVMRNLQRFECVEGQRGLGCGVLLRQIDEESLSTSVRHRFYRDVGGESPLSTQISNPGERCTHGTRPWHEKKNWKAVGARLSGAGGERWDERDAPRLPRSNNIIMISVVDATIAPELMHLAEFVRKAERDADVRRGAADRADAGKLIERRTRGWERGELRSMIADAKEKAHCAALSMDTEGREEARTWTAIRRTRIHDQRVFRPKWMTPNWKDNLHRNNCAIAADEYVAIIVVKSGAKSKRMFVGADRVEDGEGDNGELVQQRPPRPLEILAA